MPRVCFMGLVGCDAVAIPCQLGAERGFQQHGSQYLNGLERSLRLGARLRSTCAGVERWQLSRRTRPLFAGVAVGCAVFCARRPSAVSAPYHLRRRANKPLAIDAPKEAVAAPDIVEAQSQDAANASPDATASPDVGEPTRREAVDKWAYFFKRLFVDLGEYIKSPRRDFTYWLIVAFSTVLTFASDFLGSMRLLLSFNPEAAREARLDQIYQVEGLKSCMQAGKYRLRYPGDWLTDQSVLFAQQAEREKPRYGTKQKIIPDVAFGPEGGGLVPWQKRENLSVVLQPVSTSSNLQELFGDPTQAFERLVRDALAPKGSGKTIELISAAERANSPCPLYEFEYVLTRESSAGPVRIHNWSCVALGRSFARAAQRPLYTMTIVVPEAQLKPERQDVYFRSWKSFSVEC